MTASPPETLPNTLDWRNALFTPLRLFAPWLAAVVVVTLAGFPGVVCVTPMAWLIALRVGLVVDVRSASPRPGRRLQEAVLAGGLLGFLQGCLFWIVAPLMGPPNPGDETSVVVIGALMIGVGMVAGAGLSLLTASLAERRRKST